MLIRYGHALTIRCTTPTPIVCLMGAHPEHDRDLRGVERWEAAPAIPIHTYTDGFGNLCRRMVAPVGETVLSCDGTVAASGLPDPIALDAPEVPVAALPDDALMYLLGSRYCETDLLSQFAWDTFGTVPPGWGRVQAISDWVHGHIEFGYPHARATRTAAETLSERRGVCRDFTHLGVTLCRCLNIPARYVNGYMGDIGVPAGGAMDFNAWMEVYLGGHWWTFDPRNNQRRIGRIAVARGRDATDIPLVNSFGPHELAGFRVWTDEVGEDGVKAAAE